MTATTAPVAREWHKVTLRTTSHPGGAPVDWDAVILFGGEYDYRTPRVQGGWLVAYRDTGAQYADGRRAFARSCLPMDRVHEVYDLGTCPDPTK
jgi:hypothetical protein